MMKADGTDKFERIPLVPAGDTSAFQGILFDLKQHIEYYIEADGVKSPSYRMTVVELPAVAKLELQYVFPAYTGLPPQTFEDGGDVAALKGTTVRVKITPTMPTPGGDLKLDPGAAKGLTTQPDGTLTGEFKIDQDGFYHVELVGPSGERVTASPKFTIDALEDQPPSVSFERPQARRAGEPGRRGPAARACRR